MQSDIPGIWRKSDTRLVRQFITSLAVIAFFALFAFGVYFRNSPTVILGSQTFNAQNP